MTTATARARRGSVWARCLLAPVFVWMAAAVAPASAGAAIESQPITAVILIDESGSLTPQAVAEERNAAAALVSSDLSKQSKFLVAGFGSANRPRQSAVVPYCDFITASNRAARERLIACARRARIRSDNEGNDTDHAKAIQFALERLESQSVGTPVVFLMTDGVLDVRRSPAYGRVPARRNAEAKRRIDEQLLPLARSRGTQIWPLGFGPEVSKPALEQFAAGGGGANSRCSMSRSARPHALVVGELGGLIHTLVSALSAARCAAPEPPDGATLERGRSVDLHVKIPAIATDGAVTVVKSDPTFRVDFFAPGNTPVPSRGTLDDQVFERSGQGGRVETLRIRNPVPGTWRIRVSDPRDRASGSRISAFAVWEGALQASVFVSPVQPIPGRPLSVEVRVLARDGLIAGSALRGVRAEARATGNFGNVPVPLKLSDDAFRGEIPLPEDADGPIQIAARVIGRGVAADRRVETVTIQKGNFLTATFSIDVPDEVNPGDVIAGTVTTQNDGPAREGSLRLGDLSPNALLTLESSELRQIPTGRQEVSFSVKVSDDHGEGKIYGTVFVIDDEGTKLDGASLDAVVAMPPTLWDRFKLLIILAGLAALAGVAFAIIRWRAARATEDDAIDTRTLRATLWKDGQELSAVDAERVDDPQPVFRFVLRDDGIHPQLYDTATAAGHGEPIEVSRRREVAWIVVGNNPPVERRLDEALSLANDLVLRVSERADDGEGPVETTGGAFGYGRTDLNGTSSPDPSDTTETYDQPRYGAY